ncbi:MAG: hypothetical protein WA082_04895 [Candidatus Moraniibacteriota bacterium]
MRVILNKNSAFIVFSTLLKTYRQHKFPYTTENLNRLPQRLIPMEEFDPVALANFLFFSCLFMRGAIPSAQAIERLVSLLRKEPTLFDPNYAATLTPEAVDTKLTACFGRELPKEHGYGKGWVKNSQILVLFWEGNVLEVFKGVKDGVTLRKRMMNRNNERLPLAKQGFFGFQEKMSAMLAYFLGDAGLIKPLRISPPIDFHGLRVILGTEGLLIQGEVAKNATKILSRIGTKLGEEYLQTHPKVNPLHFANVLWMLSKYGCRPLSYTMRDVAWQTSPRGIKRYMQGCGACPVESRCKHYLLPGRHYVRGERAKTETRIHLVPRPKPT